MSTVYVTDSSGTREVELPDSRQAFCDEVNRLSAETGITASITPPESEAGGQPPQLYAVVDLDKHKVLARCLSEDAARGYASGWTKLGGSPVTVPERVTFPSEAALLRAVESAGAR